MTDIVRKFVEPCNDHISGILAELFFDFMIDKGWIISDDSEIEFMLTNLGFSSLKSLGVNVTKLKTSKRIPLYLCLEITGGTTYNHAGAHLGYLITDWLIDENLIISSDSGFEITINGVTKLKSIGIIPNDYKVNAVFV